MAITYSPAAHTSPVTATVGGVNIQGLAPGPVATELADQWAPTYVWLPTSKTTDGFPGTMLPFASGTGTVT